MRKIVMMWIGCVWLLAGCFQPAAVSIVEEMYQQALLEEKEQVFTFYSEEFLEEHAEMELVEEMVTQVRELGGVKLLNATEISNNNLNSEVVKTLARRYENNWYVVVNDADENHVMVWVVVRTSTHYEIVAREKMTLEDYQENIKG